MEQVAPSSRNSVFRQFLPSSPLLHTTLLWVEGHTHTYFLLMEKSHCGINARLRTETPEKSPQGRQVTTRGAAPHPCHQHHCFPSLESRSRENSTGTEVAALTSEVTSALNVGIGGRRGIGRGPQQGALWIGASQVLSPVLPADSQGHLGHHDPARGHSPHICKMLD